MKYKHFSQPGIRPTHMGMMSFLAEGSGYDKNENDGQPMLSPDLEWMLQSGQADRTLLAETLLHEYYRPVYRLALTFLLEDEAAKRATHDVFVLALAKARTYRSGSGVRIWLFHLALEVFQSAYRQHKVRRTMESILAFPRRIYRFGPSNPCSEMDVILWRAADRLKNSLRLPALLFYALDWIPVDIGCLLNGSEKEVRQLISLTYDHFENTLAQSDIIWEKLGRDILEDQLHQSLESRFPEPNISPKELERIAAEVAGEEAEQTIHRRRKINLNEVAWVMAIAVLAVLFLGVSNNLNSKPAPTQSPGIATPWVYHTPAVPYLGLHEPFIERGDLPSHARAPQEYGRITKTP